MATKKLLYQFTPTRSTPTQFQQGDRAMKKMIVAALALGFVFAATTAKADVSGFFDQGMNGSGFAFASQVSNNTFSAGPLYYQGTQQGELGTVFGQAQTFNGTNVAASYNGVALSQNNQAAVQSPWCGFSNAAVGNSGQLSLPHGFVYTDNYTNVQTNGGSAQGYTSTTVILQH